MLFELQHQCNGVIENILGNVKFEILIIELVRCLVMLVNQLNVELQTDQFRQVILIIDYVMFERQAKFKVMEQVIHGNV